MFNSNEKLEKCPLCGSDLRVEEMDDPKFLAHIIAEICNYAVKNDMEPNDTLSTVADNIKALLEISTFNEWKVKRDD